MLGKAVLHYQILDKIGAGGMGEVYLAQDTKLDRMVALKTLLPELARDKRFHDKFLAEARSAARLTHPNICNIFTIEESDDGVFIVMEFLRGDTLRSIARAGIVSEDQFRDIARQSCQGLEAAHKAGIIHRDIKSSNIFLLDDGRVKIMDFGLAKVVQEESVTQTTGIMGTYQYMSPEQVKGEKLDFRTDIFSLGVVFYELLSGGNMPFEGGNIAALAYKIVNDNPPAISEYNPKVDRHLIEVVSRALQKDINLRYHSASEILDDLQSGMSTVTRAAPIRSEAETAPENSIAVFPLLNMSSEKESEYLADGICEDVISRLTKISSLKVASRSAVFRFKGDEFDPAEVARKLGVANYLEGSIRKYDKDIRISVQMTRVADGFVVWSDKFDRKYENILQLQTEIAEMIADALGLELSGEEKQEIVKKHTVNTEAYDYFLRGKFHAKKRDKISIETAIKLMEKAIELDKNFAPAHAGLSELYGLYQNYGFETDKNLAAVAYELAEQSVNIDPGSAVTHISLGLALRATNFSKSIRELKTAVALDPSNAEAHHYLAHVYVVFGLYRSAADEEYRSLELDPFQPIARAYLCYILYYLDRKDKVAEQIQVLTEDNLAPHLTYATRGWVAWCDREWATAKNHFERTLEMSPGSAFVLDHLSDCYRRLKEYENALYILEQAQPDDTSRYMKQARLGQTYLDLEKTEDSVRSFREAHRNLNLASQHWLNPRSVMYFYNKAWIYALENDTEKAVECLKEANQLGMGHFADLKHRPDWDNLHDIPDFEKLIADIKAVKDDEDQTSWASKIS